MPPSDITPTIQEVEEEEGDKEEEGDEEEEGESEAEEALEKEVSPASETEAHEKRDNPKPEPPSKPKARLGWEGPRESGRLHHWVPGVNEG